MAKKKKNDGEKLKKKHSGQARTPKHKKRDGKAKKNEAFRNTTHLLSDGMLTQVIHGKQVSNLAYEVGRAMHLSDRECQNLIIAGFFHDIGKTVIKDSHVTDRMMMVEEMNSIREHPVIGYEILKKHNYSEEICQAVRYHHENCDGSGYPGNLDASNIPLGACILRVCDVFCALVQDRPYRSAFSMETAVNMMIEEVEKYDVRVFLAFQRVIHQGPNGEVQMPEVSPEVKGVWETL